MGGVELEAKPLGGELPGGIAVHRQRLGDRGAEQGVAESRKHQPKRGFSDMVLFVADAKLRDQGADRIEDWVQGVAIAGEDHPGGERPGAFAVERVERAVDDFASVRFACAGASHRLGNAPRYAVRDGAREFRLQACRRAEMVEEIAVGLADPRRHRLVMTASQTAKPNILVIMSDEHAPQFSEFGGHPLVKTPHLDALGVEGAYFPNSYAPVPDA